MRRLNGEKPEAFDSICFNMLMKVTVDALMNATLLILTMLEILNCNS